LTGATLSQLTASTTRLALVGLAKNTGKTEALAALLRELGAQRRRVGVTSVGRDGEEHDVIDARIDKPRVLLPAGSLVATTDTLLRASAIPHELLHDSGVRTPLGRVLVARLRGAGAIEIAGPSAAADVRAVSDAMLSHGAEQVLIDGAVDRRAASSPQVADGLLMSTGAVLDHDIAEVVQRTVDAVELVRLATVQDACPDAGPRLRELAATSAQGASVLVGEDLRPIVLAPRFVLSAEAEQIAELLDANPTARWLIVAGALPERFLRGLVHPLHKRQRELALIVADPTRVFLSKRGPAWYRRQGVRFLALKPIQLQAIIVNPVAPQSHSFDSVQLRAMLAQAITNVPIFDVLHGDYHGVSQAAPAV
jgi:hypothetical protein